MSVFLLAASVLLGTASRSPVGQDGRFTYELHLPGVQPMPCCLRGLWASETGWYAVRLDPGVRLLRVNGFAATDPGRVFEGDLALVTRSGRTLARWAPHVRSYTRSYDGWWGERKPDYLVPVDDPEVFIHWVCRVTGPELDHVLLTLGAVQTRCHFGIEAEAQQP